MDKKQSISSSNPQAIFFPTHPFSLIVTHPFSSPPLFLFSSFSLPLLSNISIDRHPPIFFPISLPLLFLFSSSSLKHQYRRQMGSDFVFDFRRNGFRFRLRFSPEWVLISSSILPERIPISSSIFAGMGSDFVSDFVSVFAIF
jgi:hypothetical protein